MKSAALLVGLLLLAGCDAAPERRDGAARPGLGTTEAKKTVVETPPAESLRAGKPNTASKPPVAATAAAAAAPNSPSAAVAQTAPHSSTSLAPVARASVDSRVSTPRRRWTRKETVRNERPGSVAASTMSAALARPEAAATIAPANPEPSRPEPPIAAAEEGPQSPQRLFAPFAKAAQAFSVNAATDTLLICPEGSQIAIPANALVDSATGKPVRGVVQFFVREYLTLPDMVLNNLTTTSGERLLETGGMLQVRAKANGRPLALKPGKTIKLALPRRGAEKPGMQVFAGLPDTSGRIDWQAAGPPTDARSRRERRQKLQRNTFPPRPFAGTLAGGFFSKWPDLLRRRPLLETRGWKGYGRKQALALITDGKAQNIGNTRAERRRLRDYQSGVVDRVAVTFDIDALGLLRNVRAVSGYEPELQAAAVRLVEETRTWAPGWVQSEGLRDTVKNEFGVLPVRWQHRLELAFRRSGRVRLIRFSQSIPRAVRDTIRLLEKGQLTRAAYFRATRLDSDPRSYYFLESANFNWINCDRFWEAQEPLVEMKVEAEQADVRLVFRDIRAIVTASNVTASQRIFQRVPKGRPVLILAMRTVGGKLEVATRETTVGQQVERDLTFRPVQPEELKQTLAAVDR